MTWDDYQEHALAGWHESLHEDGKQQCYVCEEIYDLDADACPTCEKRNEIVERIQAGELSPDAICEACEVAVSETSFLGKRLCWACYRCVSTGQATRRDVGKFADPGGQSALRCAGPGNPRIYPCPRCREPNRLTAIDREVGYVCDPCAERAERGGDY